MIGALLDRILLAVGLGGGGRVDLLNLAQNRAINLWPHRLLAAFTLLFAAVLGTGMFRQWRDMSEHRPGEGKSASSLRGKLEQTQADIETRKRRIDPKKAQSLGAQVREANALISQRALAPTELLGDLEAVKPFGGKFVGLRRVALPGGGLALAFRLKAPQRKVYEEFAARIGRARRFSGLSLRSETTQAGDFEAEIEMLWAPVGPAETTDLPPVAEKAVTRSGGSAAAPSAPAASPAATSAGTGPRKIVVKPSAPPAPHAAAPPRVRSAPGAAKPRPVKPVQPAARPGSAAVAKKAGP